MVSSESPLSALFAASATASVTPLSASVALLHAAITPTTMMTASLYKNGRKLSQKNIGADGWNFSSDEVYTAQQVHDLLGFAKESHSHIYVFLLLALFTGLRKGELMALTWSDIDFNKNTLRVNKSRTGKKTSVSNEITTPKTKSSNRVVPLNDLTIEALCTEREKQLVQYNSSKPDDYIIKNIHGLPYSNLSAINRVVNRLTEKAGLPHCTIHGFRHSVATILDENGVPLQEISILLGHESIVTTEKLYIRRRRTAKKETIDILSSAIISDKNNL